MLIQAYQGIGQSSTRCAYCVILCHIMSFSIIEHHRITVCMIIGMTCIVLCVVYASHIFLVQFLVFVHMACMLHYMYTCYMYM